MKPIITDEDGQIVGNDNDAAQIMQHHLSAQFSMSGVCQLSCFVGHPRPLSTPITVAETLSCLQRLNNGRATNEDDIPGELLKYGRDTLPPLLTDL